MERFFASDFTEFHFKKVRRDMTLIDIDAVQFREMEDGTERIRLIEYKHSNEKSGSQQWKLLKRFKLYIKALDEIATKTTFELYMIKADFVEDEYNRYNLKGKARVYNFVDDNTKILKESDLISFLNFTTEWEDLNG